MKLRLNIIIIIISLNSFAQNTYYKVNGGDIIDEIEYKILSLPNTTNLLGSSFNFYSSGNEFNYPLVEFRQMSNYNAVSLLKNTSAGKVKKQEFLSAPKLL